MQLPEDVSDDIVKRLRRASGQVQAVERMVLEGRDCKDIVTQLSAATKALENAGIKLLATGLQQCMKDPAGAAKTGLTVEEVERMLLKFR